MKETKSNLVTSFAGSYHFSFMKNADVYFDQVLFQMSSQESGAKPGTLLVNTTGSHYF